MPLLGAGDAVDRYTIVRRLGTGGMGEVYEARDGRLHRPVAIKVVRLDAPAGAADQGARLLREARLAATLVHPNIVAVYDVGEVRSPGAEGSTMCLAMELVRGRALRSYVGDDTIPIAKRVAWLTEVARALAAAHARAIVHRDVKPENVMVSEEGSVKVVDFGIAKRTEDVAGREASRLSTVTADGVTVGTPLYMAPEQMRGEPLDGRADQFSWGVVAYELLTGELPWTKGTSLQLVSEILSKDPPPVTARDARIPPTVGAAVMRALAKSPGHRFPSMDDLVATLEGRSHVTSSGVSAPSEPIAVSPEADASSAPTERDASPPPAARRLRARVIVAVAVLFALFSTALLFVTSPPQPVRRSAGGPDVTTLADLPVPPTTVPEARTEYLAGMQLLRDDSYGPAHDHFARAATLDPSMAMAHFRAALTELETADLENTRAEYSAAVALRGQLDDRDRTMLDAFEPIAGRSQPDEREALRRLEVAHERFPHDAELAEWIAYLSIADSTRSIPAARQATEMDPQDGTAWEVLGRAKGLTADFDGARAAFERCATVAPGASDCHFWLAVLAGQEGRCEDMEREGRREADFERGGGGINIATAMAALGRPDAAVLDILEQYYIPPKPVDWRPYHRASLQASLAVWGGRFEDAENALDAERDALAASPTLRMQIRTNLSLASDRVELLLERGDAMSARSAARDFMARVETLARGFEVSVSHDAWWRVASVAGTSLEPRRTRWVDERLKAGTPPSVVWTLAWGKAVSTEQEARSALDAIAHDPRLALPQGGEAFFVSYDDDAVAGHVLLLAARPSEALPHLRRVTATCFGLRTPFALVHAMLDLGIALEKTGDTPGACRAYASVLARWGGARPRSVTADEARARSKALLCP